MQIRMKTKLKTVIKFLASLIVVGGFLYGLWLLSCFIFQWISGLEKEVATAAITALIGLFGILYIQWHSKSKEIADSHRPAKIEVYNTFFVIVESFMDAAKNNDEVLDPESKNFPKELKDKFTLLSRGMIIWASPQVVKAWSKFREHTDESKTPADILLAVDDVLQAIRADLGNSNFGLRKGDVVKLYLKNPKEIGM